MHPDLAARGVAIAAVLAQRGAPVARYAEETGLPFDLLADETREVTKRYGVWHRIGLDALNIARPALFGIDRDGMVRAIFVGEKQTEYPGRGEILEIAEGL